MFKAYAKDGGRFTVVYYLVASIIDLLQALCSDEIARNCNHYESNSDVPSCSECGVHCCLSNALGSADERL
jgi:hypothetical protein